MVLQVQKFVRAFVVLAIFCLAASTPVSVFAQTTGVGDDESTSIMWKGYDSSIVLLRLGQDFSSVIANETYGPYSGYTPIAMTTDLFSNSHVVWSYTDGSILLWTLDPSMVYLESEVFGPYIGWSVVGLSADPVDGSIRLAWRNTNGAASIWDIDSDGANVSDVTLGPISGYVSSSHRRSTGNSRRKIVRLPSERYLARGKPPRAAAAAAMEAHREAVTSRKARPTDRFVK